MTFLGDRIFAKAIKLMKSWRWTLYQAELCFHKKIRVCAFIDGNVEMQCWSCHLEDEERNLDRKQPCRHHELSSLQTQFEAVCFISSLQAMGYIYHILIHIHTCIHTHICSSGNMPLVFPEMEKPSSPSVLRSYHWSAASISTRKGSCPIAAKSDD